MNSRFSFNKRYRLPILALAFIMLVFTCFSCSFKNKDVLSSWEDNSENKQAIIDFVKDVTDKNSEDFVPKEDRVAVFDADGTYYCEKPDYASNYVGRFVADYRLKNDPTFHPSDELKSAIDNGFLTQKQQIEIMAGITNEQLAELIKEFKETNQPAFNNLKFSEAFYTPMLELMDYLQDNGFQVYVISGTDPDIIREIVDGVLDVSNNQICGTKVKMTVDGFENQATNKYNIKQNEPLKRTDKFIANDKFEKVNVIHSSIGKQPIFAAGNSDGDFSMLNYTKSNPKYKSFTLMVSHDDDQREFAYPTGDKWNELQNAINENGYHRVSMKNEFKTIFKDGVTKKDPSEYRMYQEN